MNRQEKQAIRKGRFAFQTPALLFPTVTLYADRLDLSGWHLTGRFHRIIPLRQVLQIDAPTDDALLIWLSIGETLRLSVAHSGEWKTTIETHQGKYQRRRSNGTRRES